MSVALATPTGRVITVEIEPDHDRGRVYYRVKGIGCFSMEAEEDPFDDEQRVRLHVVYGHWTGLWTPFGSEVLPEAPVIYGIRNIIGGWVFDPDLASWNEHARRHPSAVVQRRLGRYASEPAPAATRRRVADIVLTLAGDFQNRADRHALDLARLRRLAPGRYSDLARRIARINEQISGLEADRATLMALADVQAAYLDGVPRPVPDGGGVLGLGGPSAPTSPGATGNIDTVPIDR